MARLTTINLNELAQEADDDHLLEAFATVTQPMLREKRETALVMYNRISPASFSKRLGLESVRLLTHAHNVDVKKYHASLARFKAAAHDVIEGVEEAMETGRLVEIVRVPPGENTPPVMEVAVVTEGDYLKQAGNLKAKIDMFEDAQDMIEKVAKARIRRKLRQRGVAPPADLSAYQKPCPTNNDKKKGDSSK